MGLFWSMVPSPDQRFGIRYVLRDTTKPMKVHLLLYQGHLDVDTLQRTEPVAETTAERWYLGKDVERTEVHSGCLRGALFKPKGTFIELFITFWQTCIRVQVLSVKSKSHVLKFKKS